MGIQAGQWGEELKPSDTPWAGPSAGKLPVEDRRRPLSGRRDGLI